MLREHAHAPRRTWTTPRSAGCSGSFLFSGDDVDKPAAVLSGGEKTRLALATLVVSSANVLMLDEPTNNLDPASREEILGALRTYKGAVVLVTHDEGAVEALAPERLILLPGRRRGPLERGLRRPRRPRLTPQPAASPRKPRGTEHACTRAERPRVLVTTYGRRVGTGRLCTSQVPTPAYVVECGQPGRRVKIGSGAVGWGG